MAPGRNWPASRGKPHSFQIKQGGTSHERHHVPHL
nr:MAG TPA: hypothetical protein [Caudoviricetes sp.]